MTPFQMEALVDSLGLSDVDLDRLHDVVGELLGRRGVPGTVSPEANREGYIEELESAIGNARSALSGVLDADRKRAPTTIRTAGTR